MLGNRENYYDYSNLRTEQRTSSDNGRIVVFGRCIKCDPPAPLKASGLNRGFAFQGLRKLYRIHLNKEHPNGS